MDPFASFAALQKHLRNWDVVHCLLRIGCSTSALHWTWNEQHPRWWPKNGKPAQSFGNVPRNFLWSLFQHKHRREATCWYAIWFWVIVLKTRKPQVLQNYSITTTQIYLLICLCSGAHTAPSAFRCPIAVWGVFSFQSSKSQRPIW